MSDEELSDEEGDVIGRGAFGSVYLLKKHQPEAVVKYMHLEEGFEEVFKKEQKVHEALTHPNIVRFIRIKERRTEFRKEFGLVMEYCARGPVKKLIFDPEVVYHVLTVVSWGKQLFSALHYLYMYNLIHGDISPNNILITDDFTPKIGDFGCAKESSKTRLGTKGGTPRYMSPPISGTVLSHYGLTHFNYESFLSDFYQKKINGIPVVEAPEEMQKLISSCVFFDYSSRYTALEAFTKFSEITTTLEQEFLIKLQKDLEQPQTQPRIIKAHKRLIRPIGFDNSEEWIPVNSQDTDWFRPPSISEDSTSINCYNLIFTGSGINLEETLSNYKLTEIAIGKGDEARQKFAGKLNSLGEIEKLEFFEKAPDIVQTMNQKVFIFQEPKYPKGVEISNLNQISIENCFKNIFLWDLHEQFEAYGGIFFEIEKFTKSTIDFWKIYKSLCDSIAFLNILQNTGYAQRISMKCYFSMATKEEWLLIQDFEDRKMVKFVKKDFSLFQELRGEWLKSEIDKPFLKSTYQVKNSDFKSSLLFQGFSIEKEESLIQSHQFLQKFKNFEVEEPRLKGLFKTFQFYFVDDEPKDQLLKTFMDFEESENEDWEQSVGQDDIFDRPFELDTRESALEADQLHFSHLEPVDVHILLAAMEKVKTALEKCIKIQLRSFVPIKTLPESTFLLSKGLGKDLPIPGYIFQLRNPPRHSCHCENPCEILGGVPKEEADFPLDMTRDLQITYKNCCPQKTIDYLELFVKFLDKLNDRFVNQTIHFHQYNLPIDPSPIKIYDSFRKVENPGYFVFLEYPRRDVSYLKKVKNRIILLDHPENYQSFEKIPCFDSNWDFFLLEAQEIRNYFNSLPEDLKSFVAIDLDLNVSKFF